MRVPTLSTPQKPRVHDRAVVESPVKVKAAHAGVEKQWHAVDVCRQADFTVPPEFRSSLPSFADRINCLHVIAQIPSRAPPAFAA